MPGDGRGRPPVTVARRAGALIGRALRRVGRMRLRYKLALSLSLAALVPVAAVAAVAVGVVLTGLERGLRDDTQRQLEVGLNLVLRTVERLGDDTVRLSTSGDLSRAMATDGPAVADLIARMAPQLPSSRLQISDAAGDGVLDTVIGGDAERFVDLEVAPTSPVVRAGQRWARRVTLDVAGGRLVMRSVAPIVDASFVLRGVVVLSVPLDADFADGIKGALGSDVLVAPRGVPGATSTFRDPVGQRAPAVPVASVTEPAMAGRQVFTDLRLAGGDYALAWTSLVDHEGRPVGLFGVAVDRRPLARAQRVAFRALALAGALALAFALGLAGFLSRRVGAPIARLHRGAIAVARGDLDHRIDIDAGDEIGDLATAFAHMTSALKENQQRLAARMREIVALHDAGRAVSSVIDLDQVLRKIVDSVARTFEVRLCALWLAETRESPADGDGGGLELRLGAAKVRQSPRETMVGDLGRARSLPLEPIAREVAEGRRTVRVEHLAGDARRGEAGARAGLDGSLLAVPLERKGAVVGVIVIGRTADVRPFADADAGLLATFADQAGAAIENARLYEQVRGASEELERKVALRTAELTAINQELGRAIAEVRETQAQLILSERMAGLGLLVAGVAHEINSPSAAIRGSVDAMGDVVTRMTSHLTHLAALGVSAARRDAVVGYVEATGPVLAAARLPTGPGVRRAARHHKAQLEAAQVPHAADLARGVAELGLEDAERDAFVASLGAGDERDLVAIPAMGYLTEYVALHRNAATIQNAIHRIQRIVSALKTYSHLDQQAALVPADLHEGLETTLALFDYALRDITVQRRYGDVPRVPIFVDELNQVWTNLIQNAVQALGGRGRIVIETGVHEAGAVVRITDDGPGIAPEIMPRIFEPFFTTKAKGQGTGLGLGIVQRIIEKHRGRVVCESAPGGTRFEVWLPLEQPGAAAQPETMETTVPDGVNHGVDEGAA
jgi:two-component system NtrC family sensor kinase